MLSEEKEKVNTKMENVSSSLIFFFFGKGICIDFWKEILTSRVMKNVVSTGNSFNQ